MVGKKEQAFVEKPHGERVGPYATVFAGSTIIIDDPVADVERSDTVIRVLPNGREERSFIAEVTFYARGIGRYGPHYQVKVGSPPPAREREGHTISIQGAQLVQIGDHNVQNMVHAFESVVQTINASSGSDAEKAEAKSRLAAFLQHPLVVSVLGAVAGTVISG